MGVCREHTRKPHHVMAWSCYEMETFSAFLARCEGNQLVTGGFFSQRPVILMFCLICALTNDWTNNRNAADLRCHRPHYDVTVMAWPRCIDHMILSLDIVLTRLEAIPLVSLVLWDIAVNPRVQFSNPLYRVVDRPLTVKCTSGECHRALPVSSQHWSS